MKFLSVFRHSSFVIRHLSGTLLLLTVPALAADPPYRPAPTLADEIKTTQVNLIDGYAKQHPRLLFSAADRPALRKKAEANAALWKDVLDSAKRLGEVPDAEAIKNGQSYWRIERVQSGALAYFVTGDKTYLQNAARWMVAHCNVPIWGTQFHSNHDLEASWDLYHIALGYDILYADLPEADRKAIRDGLASHAQAIYEALDPATNNHFTYDQNHTYIPTVALAAASLALLDDVPEAATWLTRAVAIMNRCRYVMGDDGWYYEGPGYWSYALHWHVRYADLLGRATGQNLLDLPIFRENWRFPLYLSLPGSPFAFDLDDSGDWKGGHPTDYTPSNYTMLWEMAGTFKSGEARTVADRLYARSPSSDYPAAAFLWFDGSVPAVPLKDIKPYHHFADHGFVAWRSGWGPDDTVALFRCGPPEGHAAAAKLPLMKDWGMNTGHVHADIGSFWLYGKGTYLACDTGYTAEKWTRDQNTILIDGLGQAIDGDYHNTVKFPYARLDQARIDNVHLTDSYAFASGEYGMVYPADQLGLLSLRRSVLMTKRWLLVLDHLIAERPHALTWICHSDTEFKRDGDALIARHDQGMLAILSLDAPGMAEKLEPTTVSAGHAPGAGKAEVRGFQVARTMITAVKNAQVTHLLVPLGPDEKPPTLKWSFAAGGDQTFTVVFPDGKTQIITLNRTWLGPLAVKTAAEPVTITEK